MLKSLFESRFVFLAWAFKFQTLEFFEIWIRSVFWIQFTKISFFNKIFKEFFLQMLET